MSERFALLLTDIVDSAALAQQLGDAAMAALWAAHDRLARDLLRRWRGREIDKTDGFLLVFLHVSDALAYALAYQRALAGMEERLLRDAAAQGRPMVGPKGTLRWRTRAALHVGEITLRENPAADVALGAKPFEADGLCKPVAARVMAIALGGQTLLTADAREALGELPQRVVSHGHWRLKGLAEPLELFEAGEDGAPFTPPPDGEKAYRVVRRGSLWLPARELPRTLPAERDAFVGCNAALQELARRFDDGARLVSLLGIGGSGKTRLAIRYGWLWLGDFPGGVWFCDLAPARSLEGLVSAVAKGLQLPLGQEDPLQHVGNAIAARGPCLVILDNFEQVARHAEGTLGQWLDRAARARFLVTSREPLGIAGEEALILEPMPAPDAEELFMRRAAAVSRTVQLGADDRAAVPPLVRLLDGLPLAIELAAARARTLSPRALLARMSQRFSLLASSGYRLDRQATLRAAFDWSWDLLSAAEKAALAQVSVFEGGFTLEAAEVVIDLGPFPGPAPTPELVHSLVDKSFVRSVADGRYALLVSVQAYAAEHLQTEGRYAGSGPAAQAGAEARHGAWFAALGAQRAAEHGCAELDNLMAACQRASARGDADAAAGALDGAWAALSLRGPFKAGLDLAQAVCSMPGLRGSAAAHAHAVLGAAHEAAGQLGAAASHYLTALELAGQAQDRPCEAEITISLAALHAQEGRIELAHAEGLDALRLARSLGDGALECAALNGLGTLVFEQGRMDEAQVHYEAALALARRIGHRRWQGSLLGNLGNLHANLGRMDEARLRCEESLDIVRELGDRQRVGNMQCNLGMLHYVQGRLDEAREASQAALEVARQLGHARLECIVLCNLGLVHGASDRLPLALASYEEALEVSRRIGDRRSEGQILGYLGLAHARQQDYAEARRCLDGGQIILRDVSDRMSLGVLLCNRAECECLAGALPVARAACSEAEVLASKAGAGAESELGLALDRVRALLACAGS
jgi:predicted ATPase/class 3 adenylate cyclase